jgi:integral membrane protein
MLNTTIGRLRLIGFVEGTSMLVLLFIAMPLKYFADQPLAVKYVGWIHGILFMLFMLAAFVAYLKYKWKFKILVYAFIAAFLPFGTFVFDSWLKKQAKHT